jgi:methyltransferase (TIGR00027 family)
MRNRPSNTAEDVATVRALLAHWEFLDDPYALCFLRPARRLAYDVLSHTKPTSLGRRTYAFILARTRIYDDFVRRAMDDGLRQVVIVGAGYDSRAWRLAREGVRFVEVDHPATQSRKRAFAPAGGPDFVAADLGAEQIDEVLGRSEYDGSRTCAFVCEGLTFYLEESRVRSLLGGPRSRCVRRQPSRARLRRDTRTPAVDRASQDRSEAGARRGADPVQARPA